MSARGTEKSNKIGSRVNKLFSVGIALWASAAVTLPAQTFTTLASFDGSNGSGPESRGSALVEGTDGNFYGTTIGGGGYGSIFKLTPAGALTNLYNFCTLLNCADGAGSIGGLVRGNDGNFYGTTTQNGVNGYGTFFNITPNGTLTTLYSFGGAADGSGANGVVQATDGNFYGTTSAGGSNGDGTVFKVSPNGALTTLYNFGSMVDMDLNVLDGITPFGSLVQGKDGNFYGTTNQGGRHGWGTIFKITSAGTLTTLYSFGSTTSSTGNPADGGYPFNGLIQATDGDFYGTTFDGGNNGAGAVFKITAAGTLTTLYSFCSQPGCTDGSGPRSGLAQGSDGNLYGTTEQGGANNDGIIFKITPGGVFTLLHSFDVVPDGWDPIGGLFQGTDGNLYGTTSDHGTIITDGGTVFRLQLATTAPYVCTNSTLPVITSIDSAGSYGGFPYFASGSWLEIFGSNLADPNDPRLNNSTHSGQWASSDFNGANAPTTLDGISASINGKPAYVWFLSPNQINVQAPEDTATGDVAITVTNCKASSAPYMSSRRALAPGMLAPASYASGGTQYMVATFVSDGAYVLNSSLGASFGLNSRPAKPGDLIIAYGIGFGDVTPSILPGVIVQQSNSLVNPVSISFGSTEATVSYQGLAGSFVGLYEFYITVPAGLADGVYQINVMQNGASVPQTMFLTVHS